MSHLPTSLLRRVARGVGLARAVVLASACGSDPPNVVLISIDTLRADHMSMYGYERETTPRIDEWAEGGTVFERAWAASSWTMPSMAMLVTGQVRIDNSGRIGESQATLAQALRARGYATAAVVANPLLTAGRPSPDDPALVVGNRFDAGFDSYELYDPRTGRRGPNAWAADEVSERGLRWLAANDDEPFFLFLHYFDPHHPYRPDGGPRFEAWSSDGRRERFRSAVAPEHRETFDDEVYAGIERHIALYDSEVLQTDRAVGRVLAYLESEGLAENTLVVLTADHGEGLWQRAAQAGEPWKDEAFYPALYFEHGVMLHEEQVRVPLALRGPGVPAGERVEAPASLLDVVPTVLARVDVATTGVLHGLDLFGPGHAERREVFSICSRATTLTVDGRWRLHEPRAYRVEQFGAAPELYDLERDPGETAPLDDPARIESMRKIVAGWRERHASTAPVAGSLDAEERALLDALGYTGGEADLEPPAAEGAAEGASGAGG